MGGSKCKGTSSGRYSNKGRTSFAQVGTFYGESVVGSVASVLDLVVGSVCWISVLDQCWIRVLDPCVGSVMLDPRPAC